MNNVENDNPINNNVDSNNLKTNNPVNNNLDNNNPENNKGNKKSKKIIVIIIIMILILIVIGYFLIFSKNKNKNNEDSKLENNQVEKISENQIKTVNENEIKKLNPTRNGKKVDVYKIDWGDGDYSYDILYDIESQGFEGATITKQKSFTCLTSTCNIEEITGKYAVTKEQGGIFIYNWDNDTLIYGPIASNKLNYQPEDGTNNYEINLYEVDNVLYAVGVSYLVSDDKFKTDLYSLNNKRLYTDLDGEIYGFSEDNIYSKYGYIILEFNNNAYFVNTLNGTIDYKYNIEEEEIGPVETSDTVYTVYKDRVYDINNKEVFKDVDLIEFIDNQFVISKINGKKRKLAIYDNNKKLIKESTSYDNILMIDKGFAVVINNNDLQLIDLNFKLLTTFIKNYDEEKNYLHTMLSGWYTDNNKNGIYLVIEDDKVKVQDILKDNPDMTKDELEGMDYGYEYYYIPTTKETGKIATYIGDYAKPLLYLYPKKKTKVTVKFEQKDKLTTTYPKYQDKWEVVAKPNGDLKDSKGRYYYGLYWEEKGNHDVDFKEGFYVESKNAIKFLEEKLTKLGFNERESNEFIMYWLPVLEKNKKSLVYFELTEEREKYSKILITPKPDSLLRVAMHVKKVDKKVNIKEQKLPTFERKGFTALEWGGVIH